jgi:hypothetical protein
MNKKQPKSIYSDLFISKEAFEDLKRWPYNIDNWRPTKEEFEEFLQANREIEVKVPEDGFFRSEAT